MATCAHRGSVKFSFTWYPDSQIIRLKVTCELCLVPLAFDDEERPYELSEDGTMKLWLDPIAKVEIAEA